MESENAKQRWADYFGIYQALFVFFLLMSLIDLRSAWVAASGHGWDLRFEIVFPWVICAAIGLSLHRCIDRGEINRRMGGALLLMLGFIAMYAYEAMHKLAGIGH